MKYLPYAIIAALVIVLGAILFVIPSRPPAEPVQNVTLAGMPIAISPVIGLNTSTTVSTTPAKTLLASAPGAQRRQCTNVGSFDATLSVTTTNLGNGNGFVLRSSSSITWFGDSLYPGTLYAIALGTTTISCEQL